jgi:Putative adhesin
MSQQEFFHPEQDYDATQQAEPEYQVHHRELTGEHPAWEQHDETSRRHLVGEKLHPQRSRPSPLKALILLLVLILFISCGTFALKIPKLISSLQSIPVQVYYGHKHNETISGAPSQLFPVTGPVKLSINDSAAGIIHIHTGDTNQVVVSATPQSEDHAFASGVLPLKPVQVGNTLNLTVNNDLENDDSAGVILDVYTPRDTSVDIQASSASINIENVEGQITANTDDGSITAENDELSGLSSLKSQDGDINFTGSFDAKGIYQFSSESGTIDISVPENSSFRLNTTGTDSANITNDFGSNNVGNHPGATVAVHTEEGSVAVHKY